MIFHGSAFIMAFFTAQKWQCAHISNGHAQLHIITSKANFCLGFSFSPAWKSNQSTQQMNLQQLIKEDQKNGIRVEYIAQKWLVG